jgi:RNA polymerase sigma-70 factor (ECF subfamily)
MTDSASSSLPPVPGLDFDEVFRAHFKYVWHTLRRLGVRSADLEDLTHDVFVIVHRKRDHYDCARPIKPWLFGIAANSASDYRRKASHRREQIRDDADGVYDGASAHERLEAQEERDLVTQALASIDETRLAVFVMHEIDGIPMPDIATELGIPLNTGYSRLRLARTDFAAAVGRLRARGAVP